MVPPDDRRPPDRGPTSDDAGRRPDGRPPADTDRRVIRIEFGGNGDRGPSPEERGPHGKQPRIGAGQLQWNTGGWFGGQVGSTIWLLVLGIVAVAQGDVLGWTPIGLCLVANAVGVLLWWYRDRLAPFPALELLLGTIAVLSTVAVVVILEGRLLGSSPNLPPGRWVYLYLLVFPALMVQLWIVDHARRRPGDGGDEDDGPRGPGEDDRRE